MSLTVNTTEAASPPLPGAEPRVFADVTFDNSYAEGGEAFTPESVGFSQFSVDPIPAITHGSESEELQACAVYYAEEALHILDAATGKEMAKEKDMSHVTARVTCYGT